MVLLQGIAGAILVIGALAIKRKIRNRLAIRKAKRIKRTLRKKFYSKGFTIINGGRLK